mmetsp:Transcript_16853/g.48820  ORF Transcript_16853/g.48820 Transcript_16853/m.48820 type:complete len:201 (-) Transcript_16853:1583-2185(-)
MFSGSSTDEPACLPFHIRSSSAWQCRCARKRFISSCSAKSSSEKRPSLCSSTAKASVWESAALMTSTATCSYRSACSSSLDFEVTILFPISMHWCEPSRATRAGSSHSRQKRSAIEYSPRNTDHVKRCAKCGAVSAKAESESTPGRPSALSMFLSQMPITSWKHSYERRGDVVSRIRPWLVRSSLCSFSSLSRNPSFGTK